MNQLLIRPYSGSELKLTEVQEIETRRTKINSARNQKQIKFMAHLGKERKVHNVGKVSIIPVCFTWACYGPICHVHRQNVQLAARADRVDNSKAKANEAMISANRNFLS